MKNIQSIKNGIFNAREVNLKVIKKEAGASFLSRPSAEQGQVAAARRMTLRDLGPHFAPSRLDPHFHPESSSLHHACALRQTQMQQPWILPPTSLTLSTWTGHWTLWCFARNTITIIKNIYFLFLRITENSIYNK